MDHRQNDRIMLRHCRKAPPSVAEVIIRRYLLLGMHSDIMSRFCWCCAQLNMHYCLHHTSTYRWRSSHQGTVTPNQVFPICAKHDNPFGRNLPSTVIRRCIPASPATLLGRKNNGTPPNIDYSTIQKQVICPSISRHFLYLTGSLIITLLIFSYVICS